MLAAITMVMGTLLSGSGASAPCVPRRGAAFPGVVMVIGCFLVTAIRSAAACGRGQRAVPPRAGVAALSELGRLHQEAGEGGVELVGLPVAAEQRD